MFTFKQIKETYKITQHIFNHLIIKNIYIIITLYKEKHCIIANI